MQHLIAARPHPLHSSSGMGSASDDEEDELMCEPEVVSQRRDPGVKLAKARDHAAMRLKSTFEHIFEKYERDFTGIGDEIDLRTGEIVVDNGHLSAMRHERDTGDGLVDGLPDDYPPELMMLQDDDEDEGIRLDDLDALEAALEGSNRHMKTGRLDPDNDETDDEVDERGILNGTHQPFKSTAMTQTHTAMIPRSKDQALVPVDPQNPKLSALGLGQPPRLSAAPLTFGSGNGIWGADTPQDPMWKVPEINIAGFKSSFAANLFQPDADRRYILPVHTGERSIWAPSAAEKLDWGSSPRKLIGPSKGVRKTIAYKPAATPTGTRDEDDELLDTDSITHGTHTFDPSRRTPNPKPVLSKSAIQLRSPPKLAAPNPQTEGTSENSSLPSHPVNSTLSNTATTQTPINTTATDATPTAISPKRRALSTTISQATTPSRQRSRKLIVELPKTPSAAKCLYIEVSDEQPDEQDQESVAGSPSPQSSASPITYRIPHQPQPSARTAQVANLVRTDSRTPISSGRTIPDSEAPSSSVPKSTIPDSEAPSSTDQILLSPTDNLEPEEDSHVIENGESVDEEYESSSEEEDDSIDSRHTPFQTKQASLQDPPSNQPSDDEPQSSESETEDENDDTVMSHRVASPNYNYKQQEVSVCDSYQEESDSDQNLPVDQGHSLTGSDHYDNETSYVDLTQEDSGDESDGTVIIHRQLPPRASDSPQSNPQTTNQEHTLPKIDSDSPKSASNMSTKAFSKSLQKPRVTGSSQIPINSAYGFSDDEDGFVVAPKSLKVNPLVPEKPSKNARLRQTAVLEKPVSTPVSSTGLPRQSELPQAISPRKDLLQTPSQRARANVAQHHIMDIDSEDSEPELRLSTKKRKRHIVDDESDEEVPEPSKIDVEEWFKPEAMALGDEVPWKRVKPSTRTYTRKGQSRPHFGLKPTSFSSPADKASARTQSRERMAKAYRKATAPAPITEESEAEEEEMYSTKTGDSASTKKAHGQRFIRAESMLDYNHLEMPSSPSRPHYRSSLYKARETSRHDDTEDGDILESLLPITPHKPKYTNLPPSSTSRRATASMAFDPDEDELSMHMRALAYPARAVASSPAHAHTYHRNPRKRAFMDAATPETPSAKRLRNTTTGTGTGTGTVRKHVSASGLARLAPHSPTPAAVRTPGGTLRRCGENGFRCYREFCFSCVSI
ncbi:uncharacterized protein BROUX77_007227 [Berkeleyomyces rouxiae]|uniref:uncharacterized protein n=1 Tax=Berkeleyomyces rouxiae TaxID=2035830 RepID=UPI003B801C84